MYKKTSVTIASAFGAVLAMAFLAVAIPHNAFAQAMNPPNSGSNTQTNTAGSNYQSATASNTCNTCTSSNYASVSATNSASNSGSASGTGSSTSSSAGQEVIIGQSGQFQSAHASNHFSQSNHNNP